MEDRIALALARLPGVAICLLYPDGVRPLPVPDGHRPLGGSGFSSVLQREPEVRFQRLPETIANES